MLYSSPGFHSIGLHVVYGYNMIKDKPLDIRIKQAVLTHHERMDGKGFPHQMDIVLIFL